MIKVNPENVTDIDHVLDAIHDKWFDIESDIHYDPYEKSFTIKCAEQIKKAYKYEYLLKIGNVESYTINDRAKNYIYDINKIIYNSGLKEVKLFSGFPFEITFKVNSLLIELTEIV